MKTKSLLPSVIIHSVGLLFMTFNTTDFVLIELLPVVFVATIPSALIILLIRFLVNENKE
ncbi:MAG: hypothetical protein JW891_04660 [Candidatus Lokiarchaeota archaeon]|nr:hypothetical protein [Candidatus Lokiarchaeota archaeon]